MTPAGSRAPLLPGAHLPISIEDPALDTPALLVDLDVLESNITRMQEYADRSGVALRPHIKTHKSLAIAERQLRAGASGLCVATSSEAEVMLESSAADVLLAYPIVGARKLERLRPLLDSGRLTLVTDSSTVTEGYRELARGVDRVIPVMVEIDTGMNRVGVALDQVLRVALEVVRAPGLHFRGILTHAGHAHDPEDREGIIEIARHEAKVMAEARWILEAAGIDVEVVSAGSTITAPYLTSADGITEIRPGTYVYNDLRTFGRFACSMDSLAVTTLATVISVSGQRVTLNSGSKTLTPTKDAEFGYGRLVGHPEVTFTRLSEEHASLSVGSAVNPFSVGDRVRVLPIHVCVWSDLQEEIYGVRDGQIIERIRIDAMRRSL
jgi:D-serine deaminase-like pyridoxal phosphate-dependent protein